MSSELMLWFLLERMFVVLCKCKDVYDVIILVRICIRHMLCKPHSANCTGPTYSWVQARMGHSNHACNGS